MIAHARILIFTIIYAKVEGGYQMSMTLYKKFFDRKVIFTSNSVKK